MLDNALLEVGMAVPESEHLEAMRYYGTLRPLRPMLYSQNLEGMTSRRNLAFGFRDIPLNGPALHAHHMGFSVFDNVCMLRAMGNMNFYIAFSYIRYRMLFLSVHKLEISLSLSSSRQWP